MRGSLLRASPAALLPIAVLLALLVAVQVRHPGLLLVGGFQEVQLNPSLHESAFYQLRPLQGERPVLLVIHGHGFS